jgi:hypothetical protein
MLLPGEWSSGAWAVHRSLRRLRAVAVAAG